MPGKRGSSRRQFLQGGAWLAAPLAACGASAAPETTDDQVTRLQDEAALRELHRQFLRRGWALGPVMDDGREVRHLTVNPDGSPDRIEFMNASQAVGYFDSQVELESPLARDSTLAQMAHVQGTGTRRTVERRMLVLRFGKSGVDWHIAGIAWRDV